jgi:hypothetical protein
MDIQRDKIATSDLNHHADRTQITLEGTDELWALYEATGSSVHTIWQQRRLRFLPSYIPFRYAEKVRQFAEKLPTQRNKRQNALKCLGARAVEVLNNHDFDNADKPRLALRQDESALAIIAIRDFVGVGPRGTAPVPVKKYDDATALWGQIQQGLQQPAIDVLDRPAQLESPES